MKILHVVNISFVLPYYLGEQIDFFQERGDEIFIACSNSSDLEKFCSNKNVKFISIPITRSINPITDIYSIFKLIYFIYQNRIDLVVGHTPKGGFIAMIASRFAGVKKIYMRHGLVFETAYGVFKFLLILIEKLTSYLAEKVICVSNSVLYQSEQYKLNHKSKNVLINLGTCNGIDAQVKFNPSCINTEILKSLKANLKIKSNDYVVGFIGRIVNDKGIPELLEAWKMIDNRHNYKLLLIGPIEERDGISIEYLNYIDKCNSIIHVGYISEPAVYFSLMNVFILPSLREGFPTVVLEASAMNLPVITTRNTGCIDSIIENVTGIYCEVEKISIYDAIVNSESNKKYFKSLGKSGRDRVLQSFSQKIIWENLFNFYHKL